MASFGGVVDFLLMLSIGGLAGLVIALHLKLRRFSEEANKVPALADDLTRAITNSRTTMQELAKAAQTDGARLEELVSRAGGLRQELMYVLDRAEKVLQQFDQQLADKPVPRLQSSQDAAQGAGAMAEQSPAETPEKAPTMGQALHPNSGYRASYNTPTAVTPPQPQASAQNNVPEDESKAAIMPGRYQSRLGVDQNGSPTPYRPASYQSGAAAYSNSVRQPEETHDTNSTDAESELRRALKNAI